MSAVEVTSSDRRAKSPAGGSTDGPVRLIEEGRVPRSPARSSSQPTLVYVVNVAWFFLSHRLPLARAALQSGWRVVLIADVDDEREILQVEAEGIEFHRIRVRRGSANPLRDYGLVAKLVRLVRRLRPDVMHNVTAKPVVYGTLAGRLCSVPAIVNSMSGLGYAFTEGKGRKLLRTMLGVAYRTLFASARVRIVFQNRDDREFFVARRMVTAAQCRVVVGSGVDLEDFPPQPMPAADSLQVMLPARMLIDKGVLEFAEAARLLRSRGSRARFVMAGRIDPYNPAALSEAEVRDLVERCGVEWIGHCSDMAGLIAASHIVCLPSYREGLPKALIEACAVGRPIVTTDVPGCREVVEHGVNGFLVPAREAEALANSIGTLLEDATLRERMGRAGARRARLEFDVRRVVSATFEIYEECRRA